MNISLRLATENDESFVNKLTRSTMRNYVEKTWLDEASRENYYEINKFNLSTTQIIMLDGIDVGRVSIMSYEDSIWLDEIHILEKYQSQGIGSEVIKIVIASSKQKHIPVRLKVLKTNPAKKLYENLGFFVYEEADERYYMETLL